MFNSKIKSGCALSLLLFILLKNRAFTEYIAGAYTGISAAYLGDLDTAFDYFEKAYEDRDPILTQLKCSPIVPTSLKNDPRFQNLLDRIGFPK